MKENLVYKKAFRFSVRMVNLYKYLKENKGEYVISKQVLRSSTSIGANIKEGIVAQSKKDFLSKMYIALKEASETEYWIELLKETEYIDEKTFHSVIEDCREINRILCATVRTTKKRLQQN
ncbi:MAG: four helix bundle protein [Clostridium tyrobutyricum]|uniref:four helix bundle protein n=1 Tax=Clostridium tyrobutyricum TaxID=1519 RepID=UPI00073D6243|nr:four helix bundle protein [Clostridium tyrobutyricum]MCH4199093.1 four helix bundle protein [Clostridium tyrobutyricum]MCH4259667.1 four helix bundle protein [Clostridium tyrobutyricum]MCI1240122.1 four helix bundle protein [Clostridium tyrobutyricum]MCI1651622.1 four helix bundle protein [Clostridium tyrobutyricum]MCI1938470.1 four helix bundle protein [Clostridium tyrobutyricum]